MELSLPPSLLPSFLSPPVLSYTGLLRRHGKHTNLRVFILAVSSVGKITLYTVSFHMFYIQQ